MSRTYLNRQGRQERQGNQIKNKKVFALTSIFPSYPCSSIAFPAHLPLFPVVVFLGGLGG
jgi:hypothetical protein